MTLSAWSYIDKWKINIEPMTYDKEITASTFCCDRKAKSKTGELSCKLTTPEFQNL